MAASKDNLAIEKLTATNCSIWKFKAEVLLSKEDLFHIITEDPPNPITDAWSKSDKKARALINLTIDNNQITHVKNLQTARQTWQALREIHERRNLSSKLYL